MNGLRLGPALVMTPDLDEALAFYGDVLGLPLGGRTESQLLFRLGEGMLLVFRCDRAAPAREHGVDAGAAITFEVASLDAVITALRAKGVNFLHDQPAANAAAKLRYAAFRGPGDLIHELVERA